MDIMKPYYPCYQHTWSDAQYPPMAPYFPQLDAQRLGAKSRTSDVEEIYDVNTYDSFVSTSSDFVDLGSLTEEEKCHYGNFNFFTLKRSEFNNEDEKRTTVVLNQDRKSSRGRRLLANWRLPGAIY